MKKFRFWVVRYQKGYWIHKEYYPPKGGEEIIGSYESYEEAQKKIKALET